MFCVLNFCRGFKGLKRYGFYRDLPLSKFFVYNLKSLLLIIDLNTLSLKLIPQE